MRWFTQAKNKEEKRKTWKCNLSCFLRFCLLSCPQNVLCVGITGVGGNRGPCEDQSLILMSQDVISGVLVRSGMWLGLNLQNENKWKGSLNKAKIITFKNRLKRSKCLH